MADELIAAVKKGLSSRLACSLPLPDYSAGEVDIIYALFGAIFMCTSQVCLGRGRIQGLGRLGRGGCMDTSDPYLIFVT